MKPLRNQFLLPLPHQDGSYFDGTLTYICSHTDFGAAGLIVNRPTPVDLNKLLESIELKRTLKSPPPIFEGGPVEQTACSVIHTDDVMVDGALPIGNDLGVTMAFEECDFKALLDRISNDKGPEKYMVMLGYAGWHKGQLEKEINDNVWLTCPGSHELLFETPIDRRAQDAAAAIGIDLSLLSGDSTGYA